MQFQWWVSPEYQMGECFRFTSCDTLPAPTSTSLIQVKPNQTISCLDGKECAPRGIYQIKPCNDFTWIREWIQFAVWFD